MSLRRRYASCVAPLLAALSYVEGVVGADKMLGELDQAEQLIDNLHSLGNGLSTSVAILEATKIAVDLRDGRRTFAHASGDSFDRPRPDIADCEDAAERKREASRPPRRAACL